MWHCNVFRQLIRTRAPVASLLLVSLLTACSAGQDEDSAPGMSELQWARAALERNPRLEVVAEDRRTGIFTIRDRRSGELRAVHSSELAATPVADLLAVTAPDLGSAPAEPDLASVAPVSQQPVTAAAEPASGTTTAAASEGADRDFTSPATAPAYTIEREGGRVRVSGPGVSIVSGEPATAALPDGIGEAAAAEPVICEGRRLLHIDGRDLSVRGDAVIARGGCELHITNSRIVASGIAVAAHDATVHISNSYIEGSAGSLEASGRARIYLRGTTLEGLSRRLEASEIRDLGGNDWG